MKNIHVLKTDKPSRLLKDLIDETYQLKKEVSYGNRFELPLNIYITSDEYIGLSYYLDGNLIRKGVVDDKDYWEVRKDYKKIILTTDQDLIKEGIQSIPDNFLEWFVNNPSCEEVEIEKFHGINTSIAEVSSISGNDDYNWQGKGDFRDYKIIIPKQETKQERKYSEEDLKQFAFECVGNFLSNRENELEIELVNVISDRNNKLFEQFKNK